jgi:hypothetical protein
VVPKALALDCDPARRRCRCRLSYRMQADHGFAQLLVLLAGSVDSYPDAADPHQLRRTAAAVVPPRRAPSAKPSGDGPRASTFVC